MSVARLSARRTSALITPVLIIVVLLAASCGDDVDTDTSAPAPETTTTVQVVTTPPIEPGCVNDDWQEIDAGDFMLFLPADMIDTEAQGIDSLVARYERDGMSVTYDYGWYSSDFSEIVRLGGSSAAIEISGRAASLVIADLTDEPEYGGGQFVGLFVGGEPDESGAITSLGLSINHDDTADQGVADCIARSVEFRS